MVNNKLSWGQQAGLLSYSGLIRSNSPCQPTDDRLSAQKHVARDQWWGFNILRFMHKVDQEQAKR